MLFSFSNQLRLLKPAEFKVVYEKAKKKRTDYFTLFIKPTDKNHPRLGLSISKKNISGAVKRNRYKRLIRNSFRLNQHQMQAADIIVVVYKTAQNISLTEFHSLLEKQWPQKLISLEK